MREKFLLLSGERRTVVSVTFYRTSTLAAAGMKILSVSLYKQKNAGKSKRKNTKMELKSLF